MEVLIKNTKINVNILYKNNKNVYFRFDENAFLCVSCPKNTPVNEIKRMISENEDSLFKMYQTALNKIKYNNEYWLLGKRYSVIFNPLIEKMDITEDTITIADEEALDKYTYDTMMEVFNKEIEICKKCFNNLPEFRLKTRHMKTRWGVCNRKDKIITLNTELIKKTEDIIDYVIIHEMAHFYEGNHGKKFWNIVSLACPNYKKRRAELRK